jgi:hypothetical protein
MSAGGRPPMPPPRPRMQSFREDPRRETEPPRYDGGIADVVRLLANAELERVQRSVRVESDIARIADAVEALVAMQRIDDAHRVRQESIHDIAVAVAEATGSHHVPTKTSYPPFLRDWRGPLKLTRKVAMLILTGACATAGGVAFGYGVRDCQHVTVAPPGHP